MARITVEDCLEEEKNRFALVHLASKRVKQLLKGSKPLVNRPENRQIVIALREIAAGKVLRKSEVDTSNDNAEEIDPEE